jgi:hypothetical protein
MSRMRVILGAVLLVTLISLLPVNAALSKEQRRLRIRRRIRKRITGTAERPNHKLSTTVSGNLDGKVTWVAVLVKHDANLPTPEGGETECGGKGMGMGKGKDGGDGGCVTTFTLLPEAPGAGCDTDPTETTFSTDFDFTGDDVGTEGLVFRMTPEMRDANGRKVGKSKKHQRITVEVMEPLVSTPWIVQLDKTNFMLRVAVGNADEVARADVEFIEAEKNPPRPESLSLKPASSGTASDSKPASSSATSDSKAASSSVVSGTKEDSSSTASGDSKAASSSTAGDALFKSRTLTFEDPTSAAGQSYRVKVTLYSDDGSSLGSSFHVVVVEGLEEA